MTNRPANEPKLYLETFLLSLALILLEVSYTRIFSYKLVYYFTYVIIGIALLGLGAGGIFVAVFPRIRRLAATVLIPLSCLAAAVGVLGGYLIVAETQLNAFQLISKAADRATHIREAAKLAVICLAVLTPFFAAGLALAAIFATHTRRISSLYCVDLLGAGIGCALSVPLAATISPPGAIMLGGLCLALAGLRLAARSSRALLGALVALGVLLVVGAFAGRRLPDPIPDAVKTMSPQRAMVGSSLFSRWSPVFRVDVTPFNNRLMLHHDGQLGSVMIRYNGDPATLESEFATDQRLLPFGLLKPGPKVAIIGAAGGHEILAALHFKASHVTGVELNPVTVSLITTHFADFSGHLTDDPHVTLVNAEGRSFLAGGRERYDLIWFVAPDSYAAMNAATSGAFVLSESYLYTAEMIVDSLNHLTDDGIVCAQFGEFSFDTKPNRTARYLATAREAFRRIGIHDFERHMLLSYAPSLAGISESTIILKRAPLTPADVAGFVAGMTKIPKSRVVLAGDQRDAPAPIQSVVTLSDTDLERWYGSHPFRVDPVTDDSPFFWHFVRFADIVRTSQRYDSPNVEDGLGEMLLLVLLAVVTVFAAVFLLAPMVAIRGVWNEIPYKLRAAVYFATLGAGFMFLEVSLIQRLTLFLGYPTYALTITLFALLISTGFGSLLSGRYTAGQNRPLVMHCALLLVLVAFYELGLGPLITRAIGWPLPLRVALALAFLTPLGLCLGAFMPLGLRRIAAVTRHSEAFVAWSWAVNGFFSVVSSVLATILSMSFGFNVVMLAAAALYMVGVAALASIPASEAAATAQAA